MIIKFSPIVMSQELTIIKNGETLSFNGDVVDFSDISEDATWDLLKPEHPFVVDLPRRIDGELTITVLNPIRSDASEEAKYPSPYLNVPDGLVVRPS